MMSGGYVDGYACVLGIQALCFRSSLAPADWATWAGSIGTIVAIVGTWASTRAQINASVRNAKSLRAEQLRGVAKLLESVQSIAHHMSVAYANRVVPVERQIAAVNEIVRSRNLGRAIKQVEEIPLVLYPAQADMLNAALQHAHRLLDVHSSMQLINIDQRERAQQSRDLAHIDEQLRSIHWEVEQAAIAAAK